MSRVGLLAAGVTAIAAITFAVQYTSRERTYRTLLAAGDEALRAGDSYRAIESLSGAIAVRPESMVAYYRRAEAYRAQRRPDEATRDLREAIRRDPDATAPLIALAQIAGDRGDTAGAADLYGRAADRLGDADLGLLYSLALARYRAGQPAAAIDPLRRVIARDDPTGQAHFLLAVALRDIGRPAEAVAALETTIRLVPDLLTAREELADLHRMAGHTDAEIDQLTALVTIDRHASRHVALALAQARDGRFDEAMASVNAAATAGAGPSDLELARGRVQLARAQATGDRGAAQQALASLETALAGTARRSEGLALFGRALLLTGQPAEAERILKEAAATSPVEVSAYADLADAAERLGHVLDARDALVTLDALEGDTASRERRAARARRVGLLSLSGGDATRAARYLTDAVNAGLDTAGTLGALADARARSGDRPGAQAAFARALELAPHDADLLRLGRRLGLR